MTAPTGFLDLTADTGEALLVAKDAIAFIAEGSATATAPTILTLKGGRVVPLRTKFTETLRRLTKTKGT